MCPNLQPGCGEELVLPVKSQKGYRADVATVLALEGTCLVQGEPLPPGSCPPTARPITITGWHCGLGDHSICGSSAKSASSPKSHPIFSFLGQDVRKTQPGLVREAEEALGFGVRHRLVPTPCGHLPPSCHLRHRLSEPRCTLSDNSSSSYLLCSLCARGAQLHVRCTLFCSIPTLGMRKLRLREVMWPAQVTHRLVIRPQNEARPTCSQSPQNSHYWEEETRTRRPSSRHRGRHHYFYGWGNQGPESARDLPKVTQRAVFWVFSS